MQHGIEYHDVQVQGEILGDKGIWDRGHQVDVDVVNRVGGERPRVAATRHLGNKGMPLNNSVGIEGIRTLKKGMLRLAYSDAPGFFQHIISRGIKPEKSTQTNVLFFKYEAVTFRELKFGVNFRFHLFKQT